LEAATLAVEAINAAGGVRRPSGPQQPLELVAYDDDGSAEQATLAMRSLVEEDRVVAIVGPGQRESVPDAARLAERAGVPLVTLAAIPGDLTARRWTFSLGPDDGAALDALFAYLAASGAERLGWIAPRTATAAAVRSRLVRLASSMDVRIVAEEEYNLAEESFGDRLARLSTAGAQQIVGWPREASDAASLARAAVERAPRAQLFLGPAAATTSFLTLAGEAGPGSWVVVVRLQVVDQLWDEDPLTPVVRDFRRAYRLRFEHDPPAAAAPAWDAIRLVAQALGVSGLDRSGLRDTIESTRAFVGAAGAIAFEPGRHTGLDQHAFLVARAVRGGWRIPP